MYLDSTATKKGLKVVDWFGQLSRSYNSDSRGVFDTQDEVYHAAALSSRCLVLEAGNLVKHLFHQTAHVTRLALAACASESSHDFENADLHKHETSCRSHLDAVVCTLIQA